VPVGRSRASSLRAPLRHATHHGTRRTGHRLRRAGALATAVLLAAVPGLAHADAPAPGLVRSRYETADPTRSINRDAGYSVEIPGSGQSLWLFGDTFWPDGFLLGTSATVGPFTPGRVPDQLTEVPTPPAPVRGPHADPPQRFLPVPDGLTAKDGGDCYGAANSAPATWPTGAALIPGTYNVLITYMDVCLTFPDTISVQRYGVAEYDPLNNRVLRQTTVFQTSSLPFQLTLGSPVFADDGYLYLYGSTCDDTANASGFCVDGRVVVARVPAHPQYWRDSGSYLFRAGTAWTTDWSQSQPIVPGARPAGLVHVVDARALGKGLVLVEQIDLSGGYRIWRSDAFTTGWTELTTGNTSCGRNESPIDMCRTFAAHVELSTPGELLLSYYDPGPMHLSMVAVPW
jgi:hypothetical protein